MSSWLSRVSRDNVLLVVFLCPSCFLGESAVTSSVLLNVVIKACGVKCGPAALTRLEFQIELNRWIPVGKDKLQDLHFFVPGCLPDYWIFTGPAV